MLEMPNYSKSKIYTIRCKTNNNLVYVGSTTQSLSNRWCGHKEDFKNDKPSLLFEEMRNNGGFENFFIELYEELKCDNVEQLRKREGEIIREIGTLNQRIAGRNNAGWYQDNMEYAKEKMKQYAEEHKEQIKEYHKKWREENKELKVELDRKYREENKGKIRARKTEPFTCECGMTFQRDGLARHKKSAFHQAFIANQQQP